MTIKFWSAQEGRNKLFLFGPGVETGVHWGFGKTQTFCRRFIGERCPVCDYVEQQSQEDHALRMYKLWAYPVIETSRLQHQLFRFEEPEPLIWLTGRRTNEDIVSLRSRVISIYRSGRAFQTRYEVAAASISTPMLAICMVYAKTAPLPQIVYPTVEELDTLLLPHRHSLMPSVDDLDAFLGYNPPCADGKHWTVGNENGDLWCSRCRQVVAPPPRVAPCPACGNDEQTYDGRKCHEGDCTSLQMETIR